MPRDSCAPLCLSLLPVLAASSQPNKDSSLHPPDSHSYQDVVSLPPPRVMPRSLSSWKARSSRCSSQQPSVTTPSFLAPLPLRTSGLTPSMVWNSYWPWKSTLGLILLTRMRRRSILLWTPFRCSTPTIPRGCSQLKHPNNEEYRLRSKHKKQNDKLL